MALFAYNIAVLIVFSVAAFSAAFCYTTSKERVFLYSAVLVVFFLLDHFIIFAAQFLYNSLPTSGTVSSYITIPEVKVLVLIGRQLAYLLVAKELFKLEYPRWTYIVFPLIFVLYWNLQTTETSHGDLVQVFLFYSVMQVYLLVLAVICYRKARLEEFAHLRRLAMVSIALLVLTLLFDITWMFELFNPLMAVFVYAHESNPFETLLHLLYSVLVVKAVVDQLSQSTTPASQQSLQAELTEAGIGKAVQDLRLTRREEEVFRLLLEDLTYQEICDKLVISMNTVKSHAHNIYDKAGCSRRSDLKRIVAGGKKPSTVAAETETNAR